MQTYEIAYRINVLDSITESEVEEYLKFITHYSGDIDPNNPLYLEEPVPFCFRTRKAS